MSRAPASCLRLADAAWRDDLATFTARASRLEGAGCARLVGGAGRLAMYVRALEVPGVLALGLRVMALDDDADVDRTVELRALADRLARLEGDAREVPLPLPAPAPPWAARTPPRAGWRPAGPVPDALLSEVADAGAAEIAALGNLGSPALTRARASVWTRPVPGRPELPAGAAFAASALGFLARGEPAAVHLAPGWIRLSAERGHVLVRTASTLPLLTR